MPRESAAERLHTHSAFTVRIVEDQKPAWVSIGEVQTHKDHKGFTVRLHSVPLDGVIILRDAMEDPNLTQPLYTIVG